MNPAVKLAGFAIVLLLAFGLGATVGSAVGPIAVDGGGHEQPDHEQPDHGQPSSGEADDGQSREPRPGEATSTTHPAGHGSEDGW